MPQVGTWSNGSWKNAVVVFRNGDGRYRAHAIPTDVLLFNLYYGYTRSVFFGRATRQPVSMLGLP